MTLTDYDRLAEYVPNLTQSKVRPSDDGMIRLWQEGAQKIVGFDFRASVEMFMDEHYGEQRVLLGTVPRWVCLGFRLPNINTSGRTIWSCFLGCSVQASHKRETNFFVSAHACPLRRLTLVSLTPSFCAGVLENHVRWHQSKLV